MTEITVNVCGDHWVAMDQTLEKIRQTPLDEIIVLNLRGEGPSLRRLGVIDAVMAHCDTSGRDPDTVYVSRWSNPVESIPFRRADRADVSHFYWGSDRYWPADVVPVIQDRLWGFFMGRPTVPRLLLLRHLVDTGDAVVSAMAGGVVPSASQGVNLDAQEFGERADLAAWYRTCGISSIDHACIRDQYSPDHNTNLSLLTFYDQFHIEIVAESYCHGETFFPTEKTVRPLSAGKPMIVMGPRHFLRRLRDQGFRTWSDLWDETYDDLDSAARLDKILAVIRDVQQRRDQILPDLQQHAEHNRTILSRLVQKHRPGP